MGKAGIGPIRLEPVYKKAIWAGERLKKSEGSRRTESESAGRFALTRDRKTGWKKGSLKAAGLIRS